VKYRQTSTPIDTQSAVSSGGLRAVSKTECIGSSIVHAGPYKTLADVECAKAGWADWYNHCRLHGTFGMVPPAGSQQGNYAALNRRSSPNESGKKAVTVQT